MKNSILTILLATVLFSCSKHDDPAPMPMPIPAVAVASRTVTSGLGFNYKEFYQATATVNTRKGLIILAHGDGGTENDPTLNEQCTSLAQQGYVAVTTSYRPLGAWESSGTSFKADIENVITNVGTLYMIPRNKTVLGGSSRGGNMTLALILPNGQFAGTTPFAGIKGAFLQCSGGDNWKGSAVLFPVAWMSNATDPTMGVVNGNDFKTGLTNNANPNVSSQSECLIYNSNGHCSDVSGNNAFMVRKVKEWLP